VKPPTIATPIRIIPRFLRYGVFLYEAIARIDTGIKIIIISTMYA